MTFSNFIRLLVATAVAIISFGAGGLGGATAADAQADTEIEVVAAALDDDIELDDRIDAEYEVSTSDGLAFGIAVSSSICGPFAGPDDGDENEDDILDEGETWVYTCSERFSGPTDIVTVLGRAEDGTSIRDFDRQSITYTDAAESDDDPVDSEQGDDTDDEDAGEGEDDEATSSGSSDNTRRALFWAMAGAAVTLVLLTLGFLLRRSRRSKNGDKERLFL